MNGQGKISPRMIELAALVDRHYDDELLAEECVRLNQLLREGPELRQWYARYTHLHARLLQGVESAELTNGEYRENVAAIAQMERQLLSSERQAMAMPESVASHALPIHEQQPVALPTAIGTSKRGWLANRFGISIATAALVVLCGMAIMAVWRISTAPSNQAHNPPQVELPYIAKITGLKRVRVAAGSDRLHHQQTLQLGDRLCLAGGIVELTFASGARVALEGPTDFEIMHNNEGRLRHGMLVANVPRQAAGFTVAADDVRVIDRGTEFGMAFNHENGAEVHVFEGLVEVQFADPTPPSGNAPAETVELKQGESLAWQSTERGTRAASDASRFQRLRPEAAPSYLDVADIIAGGNGLHSERSGGVNALTGEVVRSGYPLVTQVVKGEYHPLPKLPLIDGVFTIAANSPSTRIDSGGGTFSFPPTDGKTYGLVWAGSKLPEPPKNQAAPVNALIGEHDYSVWPRRAVYLVPNKGVTFDLSAARGRNRTAALRRFECVAANTFSRSEVKTLSDIWILVDGRERFSRKGIKPDDGPISISIAIEPGDRWLTIATTDGGNGIGSDWVVLGDPRLIFAEEEATTSP